MATFEEKRIQAEQAQSLLGNSALEEILVELRSDAMKHLVETEIDDQEARERLYLQVKAIDAIDEKINEKISAFAAAAHRAKRKK